MVVGATVARSAQDTLRAVESSASSISPAPSTIEWRVLPIVARSARFTAALLSALALSVAVSWFDGEWLSGVFAALLVLAMLNRAVLPSAYRVDSGGMLLDHPLRRRVVPWGEMRMIAFDREGALVRWGASRSTQESIDFPRDHGRTDEIIRAMLDHARSNAACVIVDRRAPVDRGARASHASGGETPPPSLRSPRGGTMDSPT